jgi:hypothetical protein
VQLFRFDVIFSPGRLPLVTSASFIVACVEHKRTSAVSQVLGGQFLRKSPKTIGEKSVIVPVLMIMPCVLTLFVKSRL